jgi:hypothetical protein
MATVFKVTMKVVVTRSTEILVATYKLTRHHNAEDNQTKTNEGVVTSSPRGKGHVLTS